MSNPPPLPPLRRNISRSLENISEVAAKYKKKREPALPPRPARPLAEKRLPPTPRYEPEYEAINVRRKTEVSVPLTESDLQSYDLETFCKKVRLPQAAEVTDGFCGSTEDIPVGYQLMLYFQKTARVMQAKDVLDTVYNIPLNSSLQFAPIDDLQPKRGDFSGFYYDTVEEMLQERPSLPKVICSKGSFTKGKHSVNPNDILFPKKVDKSTLGSKVVGLYCTKIGGEDVKLPLDCACGFSTDVNNTQLYLPEYIEYVNQFPVKVKVFGIDTSNIQSGMPNTLTLVAEHLLKSLVARSLHDEEDIITEISMDVPIKIRCLCMDNVVSEQERVKKTYETFTASKVSNIYSVTMTNAQCKAQQQLFAKVRRECDSKYYEIIAPDSIGNVDALQSKSSSETLNDAVQSSPKPSRHRIFKTNLLKHRTQSAGDEESLNNSDAASPVRKHKLRNLFPGRQKPQSADDGGTDEVVDYDVPIQPDIDLKQELTTLTESMKVEMKAEIKQELERSLREDIRKLRIDNAHCLQQLTRINETIEQLKNQNNSAPLLSPHIKPTPNKKPAAKPSSSVSSNSLEETYKLTPEDNRKFLQSLDHLKILQLLDGMKLERYKSEFKQSFVDGQLLATLCQTELVELQVNSALHQRKLLNVIEGKESAQKYLLLGQEDPCI